MVNIRAKYPHVGPNILKVFPKYTHDIYPLPFHGQFFVSFIWCVFYGLFEGLRASCPLNDVKIDFRRTELELEHP